MDALVFAGISLVALYIVRKRVANSKLPPVVKKIDHVVKFGVVKGENRGPNPMNPPIEHNDPYFWLRDDSRTNEDVLKHLRKENMYASHIMAHTADFCESLYIELKSHIKETDEEVPYKRGNWLYYTREVEGLAYKIRCRKVALGSAEIVLLDENELSKGKSHCDIGSFTPSPDHNVILYGADFSGDEVYELYTLDISSRKVKKEVEGVSTNVAWGADNSSFYYVVLDDNHRPYQVFKHTVGKSQSEDELLFEEKDELFWIGLGKTSSGDYLIIETNSTETGESHFLSLKEPNSTLKCFQPRISGIKYGDFDHNGDYFYFRTNKNAKNFAIMKALVNKTTIDFWLFFQPYQESVFIEGLQTFKNFIVYYGREGGYSQIWVANLESEEKHRIALKEEAHDIGLSRNFIFDTNTLRVFYESMTSPQIVYDYDMKNKVLIELKRKEVPLYDPSFYASRTLQAKAKDNTLIPMSLVYRKDLREDSKGNLTKGPVLLYGYGSYGLSMDPDFQIKRLPLLDRGMIYVIAHIRGGGDMGYTWYQDHGKYLNKKNTFEDFIACGYDLIGRNITESSQMAINGRSAGGLLMGAVTNMAPTMATAVVAGVPFVDVMTTMCDPSIPLTITEWEEWGNPNEEKYYAYMKSYSPIDNIKPAHYPAVLITGGLHDPRVAYWEPAKYAVCLRDNTKSDNPIICKIDLDSGHFSASDRYHYLKETSFDLSFILDRLQLNNTPPIPYASKTKEINQDENNNNSNSKSNK